MTQSLEAAARAFLKTAQAKKALCPELYDLEAALAERSGDSKAVEALRAEVDYLRILTKDFEKIEGKLADAHAEIRSMQQLSAAAQQADALAVLKELVACEELSDQITRMEKENWALNELNDKRLDYVALNAAAWAEARRVIGEVK